MIQDYNLSAILKKSLSKGGDFAEIYFEQSLSNQIVCEQKQIEKIVSGIDVGVGIRVLFKGQTAYGYTNDWSEQGLLSLAARVSEAVEAKYFDRDFVLHSVKPSWKNSPSKNPSHFELKEKIIPVLKASDVAWKHNEYIQQATITYRDLEKKILIANSLGELCEDEQIYTVFLTQVVAQKDGILQTGYEGVGGTLGFELFDEHCPEEVATTAAAQAYQMLHARPAPAGSMPVVLAAEAGGTMVHEAVGHGLEADLAMEGLSVYQNKIGERVASSLITVVDDKTLPYKRGSFVFDDEGSPAQKTILIDQGILKTYMHSRLYAEKAGVASTGNGRRESYKCRPIVRMTNTMIASGKEDPQEIIHSVEKGLYVKRMGGGQVNTVNGDFMFEVTEGYLLEKGKMGEAVRGATLTGNGPEILMQIDKVGSDLGFGIGTCGKDGQGVPVADAQPTLRIPEIVVGGIAYTVPIK
ncbi:MAG: TldD/PmbA family protein [Deltaproteobacteria bacterium]|nr:TldD/PmbA family protein [Deltaproteobacteria bacterium]